MGEAPPFLPPPLQQVLEASEYLPPELGASLISFFLQQDMDL